MDENQRFSVYIANTENCLRDWMDDTTSTMSFRGLTWDEASFLCRLCENQESPHDALMRIETAD